ncbi:CAP domain-containing protein [Dietzia lutea]|uniref:Secretion protein n=1 Tax=Dietzia lutea TaxID=546160 RepID=A0A2S1R4L0_9ACTN|nr:CAP domain-containing protein [Dietzia lutea]AWH91226.1 secretion protein [Dietzia lutea]
MRSTVRLRVRAVAIAAATFTVLAAPITGAQSLEFTMAAPTPCESATATELEQVIEDIHEHTNRERAAVKAAPVKRLESLDGIAQAWSERMAAEDRMYHNPGIRAQVTATYPGQWRSYGENVLQNWCGASGETLVRQWMNSPPHRVNLLNPAHTHLGVGADVADSSKLYSTQNFVSLR